MNKKSQGISINVIIIAAVALIVLVVLVAVFTGRFGMFTQGIRGASTCGEACKSAGYTNGGSAQQSDCISPAKILSGFHETEGDYCCCNT